MTSKRFNLMLLFQETTLTFLSFYEEYLNFVREYFSTRIILSKGTKITKSTLLLLETPISIFITMWKDAISTFKACKTRYDTVCYDDKLLFLNQKCYVNEIEIAFLAKSSKKFTHTTLKYLSNTLLTICYSTKYQRPLTIPDLYGIHTNYVKFINRKMAL